MPYSRPKTSIDNSIQQVKQYNTSGSYAMDELNSGPKIFSRKESGIRTVGVVNGRLVSDACNAYLSNAGLV